MATTTLLGLGIQWEPRHDTSPRAVWRYSAGARFVNRQIKFQISSTTICVSAGRYGGTQAGQHPGVAGSRKAFRGDALKQNPKQQQQQTSIRIDWRLEELNEESL